MRISDSTADSLAAKGRKEMCRIADGILRWSNHSFTTLRERETPVSKDFDTTSRIDHRPIWETATLRIPIATYHGQEMLPEVIPDLLGYGGTSKPTDPKAHAARCWPLAYL